MKMCSWLPLSFLPLASCQHITVQDYSGISNTGGLREGRGGIFEINVSPDEARWGSDSQDSNNGGACLTVVVLPNGTRTVGDKWSSNCTAGWDGSEVWCETRGEDGNVTLQYCDPSCVHFEAQCSASNHQSRVGCIQCREEGQACIEDGTHSGQCARSANYPLARVCNLTNLTNHNHVVKREVTNHNHVVKRGDLSYFSTTYFDQLMTTRFLCTSNFDESPSFVLSTLFIKRLDKTQISLVKVSALYDDYNLVCYLTGTNIFVNFRPQLLRDIPDIRNAISRHRGSAPNLMLQPREFQSVYVPSILQKLGELCAFSRFDPFNNGKLLMQSKTVFALMQPNNTHDTYVLFTASADEYVNINHMTTPPRLGSNDPYEFTTFPFWNKDITIQEALRIFASAGAKMEPISANWTAYNGLTPGEKRTVNTGNGNAFGGFGILEFDHPEALDSDVDSSEKVFRVIQGRHIVGKEAVFQDIRNALYEIFKVKLVKAGDWTRFRWRGPGPLAAVSFEFGNEHRDNPSYMTHYVQDRRFGGGGTFVEKHNFPHLFVTATPQTLGRVLIGVEISAHPYREELKNIESDKTYYYFVEVQIPYGYGLFVPPETIHGDSATKGELMVTIPTALTVAEDSADSVLLRAREGSNSRVRGFPTMTHIRASS